MNPAQKALWYIESHLADSLTLDEVELKEYHKTQNFMLISMKRKLP